jgi:beta-mannosidase
MLSTFRLPKDFASLSYLSMILQTDGIRIGVEHWRRNRNRVSGTIIWQLNDCWPAISWASLDYFGRWKALHYAARRFYAPVLLSIEDAADRRGLHVTSDRFHPWEGEIRWRLETPAGKLIEEGRERVTAAPLADTPVRELDFTGRVNDGNRRERILVCELWQGRAKIAGSVSPFAPYKHLPLSDPELKAVVAVKGKEIVIKVTAKRLALFVELALEGSDAVFSDNYFDLPARTTARISVPLPAGWNAARARRALRIKSLVDSY